ncbi:MAG: IS66 family transposase [Terriglobia bacterium]
MPRKDDQRFLELQQENLAQRHQIEDLLRQIAVLQKQLQEALDGNADLKQQLKEFEGKLDELIFQIKNLTRQDHGPTTEHHNPRQGSTHDSIDEDNDDAEEAADKDAAARLKDRATKEKRPRNHKKHINEQKMPVKEVQHMVKPDELICPHCQVETTFMTYLETSQIENLVNALVRLKHMQEVRSCPKCKGYVVTAEKPCPPIPGSYAGPCLLSSIIVDKFADALPNYRQTKRFRRQNAIIPRSTQCDWLIAASLTIQPLYELLKREVLSSKVVGTDDTWIKIQDRRLKRKMRKGKITSYVGDKRHPLNFFDFSPNLSFDKNKETFKDFKGFVQADAANGFDALFGEGSGRTEVGCSAHSRRKYWQCSQDEAYEMICGEILDIYRDLYKIEKDIRDKGSEQRLAARQQKSKPLTDQLHEKLVGLKDSLNPTNPLMKAIAYTLNHWEALIRFLDDPDFEIDNNACERVIKAWVLVRKNILFAGSDAGGKAAAIHLSFISSCNRLGIDPLEYLTDVYTRINSMKTSELDQLLPDRWAQIRDSKPPP